MFLGEFENKGSANADFSFKSHHGYMEYICLTAPCGGHGHSRYCPEPQSVVFTSVETLRLNWSKFTFSGTSAAAVEQTDLGAHFTARQVYEHVDYFQIVDPSLIVPSCFGFIHVISVQSI